MGTRAVGERPYSVASSQFLNPTLIVFIGVYFSYFLTLVLAFTQTSFHPLLHPLCLIIQILLVIVMFTPLHDAVHRSAHRSSKMNAVILHSLWPIFLNAPHVFKLIHLAHHAHTNHGAQDPDHFTSAKSWTMRWVRSFFLIFYYYVYSWKFIPRTPKNLVWMALSVGFLVGAGVLLWFTPWAIPLFFAWFLPGILGIGILGFLNTAWPHHPGAETSRIKNTKILLVPKPLEWLLLAQNYHLLHHLRPSMPWYDYKAYWRANRDRLLQEGAEVIDYRK